MALDIAWLGKISLSLGRLDLGKQSIAVSFTCEFKLAGDLIEHVYTNSRRRRVAEKPSETPKTVSLENTNLQSPPLKMPRRALL